MSELNRERWLELRDQLMQELEATQLKMTPSHRDLVITQNGGGPRLALWLWVRYDLIEWPSNLVGRVVDTIKTVSMIVTTICFGLMGIALSMFNLLAIPLLHLVMALFGGLAVRYHPDSVRQAYSRVVRSLPSYNEYLKAGGTFNANDMVVPQDYLDKINAEMAKRESE